MTDRSFRPHWPTRCLLAAAVWPCSSASWVSPLVFLAPPPHFLSMAGEWKCRFLVCAWGAHAEPIPSLPSSPRHHQRAVSVLCRPHGAQGSLPVAKLPAACRCLQGPPSSALPSQIQVPLCPDPPPGLSWLLCPALPSGPALQGSLCPLGPAAASPMYPSCRLSYWRSSAHLRPSSLGSMPPSRQRPRNW